MGFVILAASIAVLLLAAGDANSFSLPKAGKRFYSHF
jgi:hypothetical protein